MKTKSALSYFGSDSEVAPQLGAMLDHCKHVTIPFVGGGSIIPYLKARAIVANDLDDLAINFYRVMSCWYGEAMREEVINRCEHTLSHPSDLELARETIKYAKTDHVEKAWAFWALCWIGRKGKGGTKNQDGMPSVRRTASGGTNASRIRAAASDLRGGRPSGLWLLLRCPLGWRGCALSAFVRRAGPPRPRGDAPAVRAHNRSSPLRRRATNS